MADFVWKPDSAHGGLAVLFPSSFPTPSTITIRLSNGQIVTGHYRERTNGNRPTYDFPNRGASYGSNITLYGPNNSVYSIGNGGNRYENLRPTGSGGAPKPENLGGYDSEGNVQEGGGFDAEGNPTGASVGVTEGEFPVYYPQAGLAPGFNPVNFQPIPNIEVPVVDPVERAGEVGAFNIKQFQTALDLGRKNAQDLIQGEFEGLQTWNRQARGLQAEGVAAENISNQGQVARANEFNRSQIPAANEFNKPLVADANEFNQAQRLAQLDAALPEARPAIKKALGRAATLSEGRFPSTLEDRAFETASNNAAADNTQVRGFGDDSVVGRKASDLLSAQQRLQLSQVGAQQTDRFLTLGANLQFDQPIKFNPIQDQPLKYQPLTSQTSQQISGAPARPASELAVQQQDAQLPLTTIQPGQAIGFDIGQNQYQAGLTQQSNMFNSSGSLEAQKFNSTGAFAAGLEQFNADVFNAQTSAGAGNASIAQGQAQENFDSAQTAGYISTGLGLIGGLIGGGGGGSSGGGSVGGGGGGGTTGGGGGGGGTGYPSDNSAAQSPQDIQNQVIQADQATGGHGGSIIDQAIDYGADALSNINPFSRTSNSVVSGGPSVSPTVVSSTPGSLPAPALAVPAAIVATSEANGMSVADTVNGLSTGRITNRDLQNGLNRIVDPESAGGKAMKDLLSRPVTSSDTRNAMLLANPTIAPLLAADTTGSTATSRSHGPATRDVLREHAEASGVLFKPDLEQVDQGFRAGSRYMELAKGASYNVSTEGKAQLRNYGSNIDGRTTRDTHNIDWSDPRTPPALGMLNPAALMIYGDKFQSMVGHTLNGATSDNATLSETKANIRHQVDRAGIDYRTGTQLLTQYRQAGKLTEPEYTAFLGGWNELMLTEGVPNEVRLR